MADIREYGYGLVKNALDQEQIEQLKSAIEQQARGEAEAGVAKKDGGPQAPNQRIWTLINKGKEFHDLLEHPLIDEVVPELLGEHALLHSYSANIARPGNVPMMLHTDQVAIQPPLRNICYGLNIMWFLTDVTRQNGGTRIFPGSHIGHVAPDDPFNIDGTLAAEGPAGTALVFESRLWHATGPNEMTSGERPVILMFFMRSFIRQQENNFLSIRPEVEATMSDKVRRLLGYCTTGALGGVEGEVREGIYVERLKNPVGPFRDTHKHTPYRQSL
jgi:ectoine hydroxylase-related dioxygenase (phytanoyl-CoA dioxygenase family)